jgi:cytochrome c oxidase subunit IV
MSDHIEMKGKNLEHYEGDQSSLYSGMHHQDATSEDSRAKVKNIWKVTGILTLITIVEVALGLWGYYNGVNALWLKVLFILGTLLKAGYIVAIFMHLGDEFKNMILTIIVPLSLFIWFIIAFLADGNFWLWISTNLGLAR